MRGFGGSRRGKQQQQQQEEDLEVDWFTWGEGDKVWKAAGKKMCRVQG